MTGHAAEPATKPTVLLADDDLVSRKLVEVHLRRFGYHVVPVGDGEAALAALGRPDAPQLAVLDWEMPGLDGPEVCRRLRARAREAHDEHDPEGETARYTFVILLTGRDQLSDLLSGFEAGADDYLTKPFEPTELRARLRAGERIVALEQRLLAMKRRLEIEATHDALTGVWNRRALMTLLARELARGQRHGTPLTVALLDLDHFKRVNDTHGHQVGDDVLVEAARRFSAVIRVYDAVGRYGGEEFVVMFAGCAAADGLAAADRLRSQLSATPVCTRQGPLVVSASIGVAHAGQDHPYHAVDTLLHAADRALYRAKDRGRNRVEAAGREDYAPQEK